jgi:enoyl-CoA hydratase
MKLVVNHAYENMGISSTQTLGPILDGLMRNTPDARRFIEIAERRRPGGDHRAGRARSATTARPRRSTGPNPEHVITP